MNFDFTDQQLEAQEAIRSFTQAHIAPAAGQIDREQKVPAGLIKTVAEQKYLGSFLPKVYGGLEWDMATYGILNEEIGKGCSSVRSLLTVHGMCSYSIMRWGTDEQKDNWLPKLAAGELIGAFALTEPDVGSDAKSIQLSVTEQGGGYVLNGIKQWITFGQIADLFLVIGQLDSKPVAFIVERDRPGLRTEPIRDILGTRGSMLSTVFFENCEVPASNMLAGVGFGFSAIALSALNVGRYSVATGSVGIAQACLEASIAYANERHQFGGPIGKNQLIRRLLTDMDTNTCAARFFCQKAGYLMDIESIKASSEIMKAKYFAGKIVSDVARDAVQIHGGNGCSQNYPVERLFRDAKIMEIIEGTNQMLQLVIGKDCLSYA